MSSNDTQRTLLLFRSLSRCGGVVRVSVVDDFRLNHPLVLIYLWLGQLDLQNVRRNLLKTQRHLRTKTGKNKLLKFLMTCFSLLGNNAAIVMK